MKYQVNWHPEEPHAIQIHVDQLLLRGPVVLVEATDDLETIKEQIADNAVLVENMPVFYDYVAKLPGMEAEFILERYCMTLYKAQLFSWDELLPQILALLLLLVASDGKLQEVAVLQEGEIKERKAPQQDEVPKE